MKVPIILYTHSDCSFVWKATIGLLEKYASKFTIYWVCDTLGETQVPSTWNVRFYDSKEPWSFRLLPTLKEITEDYVIYLQEDWLLINDLCEDRTEMLAHFMKAKSCEFLVSYPCPTMDKYYTEVTPSFEIGSILFFKRPFHNMQPAIWKKSLLEEICALPIKISEYEGDKVNSITSQRNCFGVKSKYYPTHYSVSSPLFPHIHAVCGGNWTFLKYPTLKVILELLGVDTTTRDINTTFFLDFQ
jgi:hypothetical protein